MSEMVERVALALQRRAQERGCKPIPRFVVNHLAAAAIEAMREPTRHMVESGDAFQTTLAAWRVMIDEALR